MADFPSIRTGVVTQLPFTSIPRFSNAGTEHESGQRYSYYYLASPLRRWELSFPVLTLSELDTLIAFYESVGGAWDTFTFTDPDTNVAYNKCRFADESFSYERNGPICSARLVIEEFK